MRAVPHQWAEISSREAHQVLLKIEHTRKCSEQGKYDLQINTFKANWRQDKNRYGRICVQWTGKWVLQGRGSSASSRWWRCLRAIGVRCRLRLLSLLNCRVGWIDLKKCRQDHMCASLWGSTKRVVNSKEKTMMGDVQNWLTKKAGKRARTNKRLVRHCGWRIWFRPELEEVNACYLNAVGYVGILFVVNSLNRVWFSWKIRG